MSTEDADTAARVLRSEIAGCQVCARFLPLGPRPVVQFASSARLLIVGQAPGARVHVSGVPWDDASGERLRDWIGIGAETFYDPGRVALLPMGFCYPGAAASGGDLPPRPECAPLWHERVQGVLVNIELTLLVGQYAQRRYLGKAWGGSLTDTVRDAARYLPAYLPLPHPSWRSTGWMRRNPWFETGILPLLRESAARALDRSRSASF